MAEHEDKKNEAAKTPAPAPKAAEPKAPPPTTEEVNKALEDMVVKAEAAGMRDDPTVASSRAILDRMPKKEAK